MWPALNSYNKKSFFLFRIVLEYCSTDTMERIKGGCHAGIDEGLFQR